jgi:hypothetical protein
VTVATHFDLRPDTFGRWRLTLDDGVTVENVSVVRAFPISQPERGFSIVDALGHERVWIEQLRDLPDALAQTLRQALASREFMPEIYSISAVSTFATPSTWHVLTDRGETKLVLKGEEDIRRLGVHAFVIADRHGIHYLIRDISTLDKASRKLLDRFL